MSDGGNGVRDFYGRWARLYDLLARYTPGVGGLRARTVDALELEPGDAVLDVGCGTGATLPYLREQVGPDGTVVGLDPTGPMLDRARRLVARRDWSNVHLLRADGARPPLADGSVDAVVAAFVVGMFEDPAAVVDGWCDILGPGGRIALLNAARGETAATAPLNLAVDALTVLSTPPTLQFRYERDLTCRLTECVEAAARTVESRAETASREHVLGGTVRLTSGTMPGS